MQTSLMLSADAGIHVDDNPADQQLRVRLNATCVWKKMVETQQHPSKMFDRQQH
jgi:hypothetical protein